MKRKWWLVGLLILAVLVIVSAVVLLVHCQPPPLPSWLSVIHGTKSLSAATGPFYVFEGPYHYLRAECPGKPKDVLAEIAKNLRTEGFAADMPPRPVKRTDVLPKTMWYKWLNHYLLPFRDGGFVMWSSKKENAKYLEIRAWPRDNECLVEIIMYVLLP